MNQKNTSTYKCNAYLYPSYRTFKTIVTTKVAFAIHLANNSDTSNYYRVSNYNYTLII